MAGEDKVNILVVDDVPGKLLAMTAVLAELHQNIVTASSGREALRSLLTHEFAVILLDVNMPDMDGFETAALIRQRQHSEHTPIIFLTADGDETHSWRGYSLGAVDYILTPAVPGILRTKVGVFVDLFLKNQQLRHQADQRVALAREQAARTVAEEATRRSQVLAETSAVLSRWLDGDSAFRELMPHLVPYVADLSAIAVRDERRGTVQTTWAWIDPATGGFCHSTEPPPDVVEDFPEALEISLNVGRVWALPTSLVLPLQARGKTLGAVLFSRQRSGGRYDAPDLSLAQDLAGRMAIALDNIRLYQQIQERDHRKDEFLALLAHELRNPLAPIRNAIEILRLGADDRSTLEWVAGVLDRQVQQLIHLVDDLLDVSRITRGKLTLRKTVVDVTSIVAQAVETSRPFIQRGKHQLTLSLPPERLEVEADPNRMAQVLSNLLNNAARYTADGGMIHVTVSSGGQEIVIRVRDTGVGISDEMLPKVFEPFMQVDTSPSRSREGLGIGLTLVRAIVELHGGTVQAASAGPGQGSEFTLHLPGLHAGASRPVPEEQPTEAVPPVQHSRILVVDDNKDAAQTLTRLLRATGHVVEVVHDGPTALETARSFLPELVLLDIGMPEMDGYEVARRLRTQAGTQPFLLAAVTGYGQPEDRLRSQEAGFDFHLTKPLHPGFLRGILAARART